MDLFIDHIHAERLRILFQQIVRSQSKKCGSDQLLIALLRIRSRHQITRQLFLDELVERLVAIHRVDDIIAVPPREWERVITPTPDGLRVPRDVKPVTAPAFAESLRSQKVVHDLRVGVLACVL